MLTPILTKCQYLMHPMFQLCQLSKSSGWLVPDGCLHTSRQLRRLLFHFLRWPTKWYAQGWSHKVDKHFVDILCFNFICALILDLNFTTELVFMYMIFHADICCISACFLNMVSYADVFFCISACLLTVGLFRSLIFSRVENQGWSTCWRKIQTWNRQESEGTEKCPKIPEQKSYRIHIWCCESPTLPRPS